MEHVRFTKKTRELKPNKGFCITNKEHTFFSNLMYLGIYDKPENYIVITEEERDALIKEKETKKEGTK